MSNRSLHSYDEWAAHSIIPCLVSVLINLVKGNFRNAGMCVILQCCRLCTVCSNQPTVPTRTTVSELICIKCPALAEALQYHCIPFKYMQVFHLWNRNTQINTNKSLLLIFNKPSLFFVFKMWCTDCTNFWSGQVEGMEVRRWTMGGGAETMGEGRRHCS